MRKENRRTIGEADGTTGVDAAAAGRCRERGADALLGEQVAGFRPHMLNANAQHHLARNGRRGSALAP